MMAAIMLGYFCGKFIFEDYQTSETTFQDVGTVYFLQQGVYSSLEAMEQSVEDLSQYLYRKEEDKYYVYFGITSKKENAEKVKELYSKNNKVVYIKQSVMTNQDFLSNLIQYDILLNSSNTMDEVNSVLKAIIASYQEFVVSSQ